MCKKVDFEIGIQLQKSKLASLLEPWRTGSAPCRGAKANVGSPASTNQRQGQMGSIMASKTVLGSIFSSTFLAPQKFVKIKRSKSVNNKTHRFDEFFRQRQIGIFFYENDRFPVPFYNVLIFPRTGTSSAYPRVCMDLAQLINQNIVREQKVKSAISCNFLHILVGHERFHDLCILVIWLRLFFNKTIRRKSFWHKRYTSTKINSTWTTMINDHLQVAKSTWKRSFESPKSSNSWRRVIFDRFSIGWKNLTYFLF